MMLPKPVILEIFFYRSSHLKRTFCNKNIVLFSLRIQGESVIWEILTWNTISVDFFCPEIKTITAEISRISAKNFSGIILSWLLSLQKQFSRHLTCCCLGNYYVRCPTIGWNLGRFLGQFWYECCDWLKSRSTHKFLKKNVNFKKKRLCRCPKEFGNETLLVTALNPRLTVENIAWCLSLAVFEVGVGHDFLKIFSWVVCLRLTQSYKQTTQY